MKIILLVALWVTLSSTAIAIGQEALTGTPSFDCSKAGTPTEFAICDDTLRLADMDFVMARLYTQLKFEGLAVKESQRAWLLERNSCGGDNACLTQAYVDRLRWLAQLSGDEESITGLYSYQFSPDTNAGDLWLVRNFDNSLSGGITSVSGPTYHLCALSISEAKPIGNAWLWTSPNELEYETQDYCHVLIRRDLDGIVIDSSGCEQYCGARGWFDEVYQPQ